MLWKMGNHSDGDRVWKGVERGVRGVSGDASEKEGHPSLQVMGFDASHHSRGLLLSPLTFATLTSDGLARWTGQYHRQR
jgi:hypothetical protein